MRLPGMGESLNRNFRDKLAMRVSAKQKGVPVPEFTGVFNYDDLHIFLRNVPGPWLLKPRTNASAIGIRKIESPGDLWPILDQLGDLQSHYVLERFVPGEIFHVEGVTWNGKVLFGAPYKYGKPPMQTMHQGGIFSTRALNRESIDALSLNAIHKQVIESLGLVSGVTHTEFIKSHADGRFYFLETAARVGWRPHRRRRRVCIRHQSMGRVGKNRSRHASQDGIHAAESDSSIRRQRYLPRAARASGHQQLRRTRSRPPSQPPSSRRLILCANSADRIEDLIAQYTDRFLEDFCAVVPPPTKPTA